MTTDPERAAIAALDELERAANEHIKANSPVMALAPTEVLALLSLARRAEQAEAQAQLLGANIDRFNEERAEYQRRVGLLRAENGCLLEALNDICRMVDPDSNGDAIHHHMRNIARAALRPADANKGGA